MAVVYQVVGFGRWCDGRHSGRHRRGGTVKGTARICCCAAARLLLTAGRAAVYPYLLPPGPAAANLQQRRAVAE